MEKMGSSEIELERHLREAGGMLNKPPPPVDELLPLLDQVEKFLSMVEQSPSESMQDSISSLTKALVEDGFFRHANDDVRVAVASCISEITRITAPDAPYDDQKMKDVFKLIVSSFEKLPDKSSRSYKKIFSIIEILAKVRSCVVMLDLELDALIIEMFQHFLKSIRDYHPENIFTAMVTIMTLVLEESDDISPEILTSILTTVLASLKKDNKEFLPIAQKLGERVFKMSADKLKPYILQTVKFSGNSLENYSDIVASIFKETNGDVEHNDENASGQKLEGKKDVIGEACPAQVDPTEDEPLKLVMDNGTKETLNADMSVDPDSSKKPVNDHLADANDSEGTKADKPESKSKRSAKGRGRKTEATSNRTKPRDFSLVEEVGNEETPGMDESNDSDVRKLGKLVSKAQSGKGRGNTQTTKTNLGDPSDSTHIEDTGNEDVSAEPVNDHLTKSKTEPTSKRKGRKPTTTMNLIEPSGSSRDSNAKEAENFMDSAEERKQKQHLSQELPSVEVVSPKASESTSDLQGKPKRHLAKKATFGFSKSIKVPASEVTSKDESGTTSEKVEEMVKRSSKKGDGVGLKKTSSKQPAKKENESDSEDRPLRQKVKKRHLGGSEEQPLKHLAKKGKARDSMEEPLLKQLGKTGTTKISFVVKSSPKKEDAKKSGRGKDAAKKGVKESSAEDDKMVSSPNSATKSVEDERHLQETPRTKLKRKRTPIKEKDSGITEHGEDLVGSKVKVWWPEDITFYEGVIKSFDRDKKKHKVIYTDGDEEILNLTRERWELIEKDGDKATEDQRLGGSSEMHKKKKAKSDTEPSPAEEDASSKRKSKGVAVKSGRKTKDGKVDNKSKDKASKSSGKSSEDTGGGRSIKGKSPKSSGKFADDSDHKPTGKSKDAHIETPKVATKPQKAGNKSKGKTPITQSKTDEDGSRRAKLSKNEKEVGDAKGKSGGSGKKKGGVKGGAKRKRT